MTDLHLMSGVGFGRRAAHLSGNLKEFLARGLPKMQGTQVEPGTSQFRRPLATIVARRISTIMMRPDLTHSPRLISTPFRQSRVLLVLTLILFDPNTAHHHKADEPGDKPDHAKDIG
jgi:hypothetical protein